MRMYWLNQQTDHIHHLYEDIDCYTMLKDYKVGYRGRPKRFYVVCKESAEFVIEELRKAGYQVTEITNYD